MNWQHLRAFLWLRWRLLANGWRRAGALNAVLMTIVVVCALVLAVPLALGCFFLGTFAFPGVAPMHLLYAWDAMVISFMFCWGIGLMADLQRTETLSLAKFLHLPVSVNAAFLINYVSSLVSLTLIIFVPVMFGFALALAVVKGALLLAVLPLTAAFLFMVTALTYQFQGWLASLMSNPRRRRTVVVAATLIFVLIFQLPNLMTQLGVWNVQRRSHQSTKLVEELAKLDRAFHAQELSAQEHLRKQKEILQHHEQSVEHENRQASEALARTSRLANLIVPIGWLPLGVMGMVEGNAWPAILGFLGMSIIGAASLWRAYRTTVRLYQGQFTARKSARPLVVASALPASPEQSRRAVKSGSNPLEARLPGFSEPVSVIALGGLRSIVRSAEGKMMLVTPLILGVLYGSTVWKWSHGIPVLARPLAGILAMMIAMLGMLQIMANQFGFDRDGFRVFVLCAARRRDILLGKNLAFAPLTLAAAAIPVIILQLLCPMRADHLLAMFPQFISMFLLFCLLSNVMSIVAPMPIAAGSLKPANPKLVPVLLQMIMFLIVFPLIQAPTLLPLGVEAALEWLGYTSGIPIYLLLTLLECAAVIFFYRFCLNWQGDLLQAREQKILETVTGRAP